MFSHTTILNPPHKLSSRSRRCIFIGYAFNYKGYRCLDPQTDQVYVSRHVLFHKDVFPYPDLMPFHVSSQAISLIELIVASTLNPAQLPDPTALLISPPASLGLRRTEGVPAAILGSPCLPLQPNTPTQCS